MVGFPGGDSQIGDPTSASDWGPCSGPQSSYHRWLLIALLEHDAQAASDVQQGRVVVTEAGVDPADLTDHVLAGI